MADNYTGTYTGISKGEQVRAKDMTDALNQMEKVANKKDTIANSSAEYPSSKAVYENLSSLNFFPKGTILTFSSEAWGYASEGFKNIWKICDGNNGTPNLINKFIRGGTSSGATGGADSQTVSVPLPLHSHKHNHDTHIGEVQGYDAGATNVFENASGVFSVSDNAGRQQSSGGSARDAKYKLKLTATHNHDETTAGVDNAEITVSSVPSYYTAIYIIKVV